MLEQFMKHCSPWEGPTLEKFVHDYILWRHPTLEQENNVSRKGQQKQSVINWPHTQFPIPLCCSGSGWGGRRVRIEAGPWRKGRQWGKDAFSFLFLVNLLFLNGNKLIFPKSSLFFQWWHLVNDLPVIILTHELFIIFSPLPCWGERGWESSRMCTW